MIAQINNKILESAEENVKTMIEIAEDKKESAFDQISKRNRIVKTAKEKKNAADTMQDEIYDPRTVSLEAISRSNKKKER